MGLYYRTKIGVGQNCGLNQFSCKITNQEYTDFEGLLTALAFYYCMILFLFSTFFNLIFIYLLLCNSQKYLNEMNCFHKCVKYYYILISLIIALLSLILYVFQLKFYYKINNGLCLDKYNIELVSNLNFGKILFYPFSLIIAIFSLSNCLANCLVLLLLGKRQTDSFLEIHSISNISD